MLPSSSSTSSSSTTSITLSTSQQQQQQQQQQAPPITSVSSSASTSTLGEPPLTLPVQYFNKFDESRLVEEDKKNLLPSSTSTPTSSSSSCSSASSLTGPPPSIIPISYLHNQEMLSNNGLNTYSPIDPTSLTHPAYAAAAAAAATMYCYDNPSTLLTTRYGAMFHRHNSYGMDHFNGSRRKNATRETTSLLKDWLNSHRKNPYPTKGEKVMLAIITQMTLTQVSTWFANARRRLKKENKMTWSPRNRCDDDDDDATTNNNNNSANDSLHSPDHHNHHSYHPYNNNNANNNMTSAPIDNDTTSDPIDVTTTSDPIEINTISTPFECKMSPSPITSFSAATNSINPYDHIRLKSLAQPFATNALNGNNANNNNNNDNLASKPKIWSIVDTAISKK